MKEGRWDRKIYAGHEVAGKTLGVIGFGRIGREISRRMKSFDMKIVAYDPFLTDAQFAELGVQKGELEDIWRQSDYITVHTPLIPQTKSKFLHISIIAFIDKKEIKKINNFHLFSQT